MKPIAVAIIIIVLTVVMSNIKFQYVAAQQKTTAPKALQAPKKVVVVNEPNAKLDGQEGKETRQNEPIITPTSKPAEQVTPPVAQIPIKTEPPIPSGSVESVIAKHAANYQVDLGRALRIAKCESTTGRNLVNTRYTAPDGSHPTGVYQFTLETWYDFAKQRGWPAVDERLNTEKNIEMTMWAWTNGYANRWECR
jgi:hypothetical protein